jgi:hypothetical protein
LFKIVWNFKLKRGEFFRPNFLYIFTQGNRIFPDIREAA